MGSVDDVTKLEEMADVRKLQERTGIPSSWWYTKAEAGDIPSYKLGKYRRFKWSEIEAWLATQRQGPSSE
jgi:excisionase family DNA binding protein